jgi:glycosyltransferase involved in cell wall biosynthesis
VIGPGEPLILTAGRVWDEAKNVAALWQVAPALPWPVYVAGEMSDPGRPDSAAPAASVHYLGRLEPDALAGWMRRASIYALPARYEPFGLSIVEAAAAGCALVLGDIRTLRENWSGAAAFVPPDNHRALCRTIEELIKDPDRRVEMGRAARERSLGFTVSRMADAYIAAYSRTVTPAAAA